MEEKWESRLLGVFGGRRKKEKIKMGVGPLGKTEEKNYKKKKKNGEWRRKGRKNGGWPWEEEEEWRKKRKKIGPIPPSP